MSCGHCGLACTARATNGRNFYYLCGGKGHSTFSHRATCCPARHTPAGRLDELVWNDRRRPWPTKRSCCATTRSAASQFAGVAASLEAFRGRVQHGLATATFEQRRQLALLLIDRVVVTDAEVEIRYVLPTSPESEHVRFCHLRKDYFAHPRLVRRGPPARCAPWPPRRPQRR